MPKRIPLAIAILIGVCAAVQSILVVQYLDDPFYSSRVSDALSYDQWASRIAAEGLRNEPAFHQAPLYPALLAVAYRLGGPARQLLAVSLQALLHCFAVLGLVALGQRVFGSRAAGVGAGCVALLYGPFAFHATKLLPVTLATFTQVVALLLLVRARDAPRVDRVAVAGLVWGLACLARPEMLLFLPLGSLALFYSLGESDAGTRAGLVRTALFLVAAALAIAPATAHNLRRSAPVLIASSAGENLYIGNQRGADGGHAPLHPQAGDLFSQRTLAGLIAERERGRELNPAQISAFWRGRAFDEIRDDPLGWLRLEWRKLRRVLSPGDPTDMYSLPLERGRYLSVLHLLRLPTSVLWILASIGAWLSIRRVPERVWPLFGLVGVHLAVLLAFFVSTRLRLPLLFLLTPFAGLAVAEAFRRWQERNGRGIVAAVGLVMLVLVVHDAATTEPPPRETLRLASILSRQDRLDESLEVLESLTEGPAPDPLALDQTGWVRSKRGELEEAREAYERALEVGLPPFREAQCRSRLAELLERLGRGELASREHDLAVAIAPDSAGARYERGLYRARRGDREGALTDLRAAIALAPEWTEPRDALRQIEDR